VDNTPPFLTNTVQTSLDVQTMSSDYEFRLIIVQTMSSDYEFRL